MAIQSETSTVQYEGTHEDLEYNVPFLFFDEEDLIVMVTNADGVAHRKELHTHYTVSGAGRTEGGMVTLTAEAGIDDDSVVTIYREVEATQKTIYEEGSEFPAKSHERALDKLTMLHQQLARSINRSVQVPPSDDELEAVPAVANSILGFDAGKQPRTYTLEQLVSFLNVTGNILEGERPMATFADATLREAAGPDFTGQLATQTDENSLWIGNAEGGWDRFNLVLGNGDVALENIENVTASRLLGRGPGSAGTVQEIQIGSGLTFTGVTLAAALPDAVPSLTGYRGLKVQSVTSSTLKFEVAEILLPNATNIVKFKDQSVNPVSITVSGLNGLDTGSEESSKWYYIWAVSDGTNFRGLLSASATNPVVPGSVAWVTGTSYGVGDYVKVTVSSVVTVYRCQTAHTSGTFADDLAASKWVVAPAYDYKLLLGAVRNDGSSNFVEFFQVDREVSAVYKGQASLAGHTDVLTALSISSFIPPEAVFVYGNAGTTSGNALITIAGSAAGLGRCIINHPNTNNFDSFVGCGPFGVPVPTANTIYYKTMQNSAVYSIEITGLRYL